MIERRISGHFLTTRCQTTLNDGYDIDIDIDAFLETCLSEEDQLTTSG